jgi:hypothetical protein
VTIPRETLYDLDRYESIRDARLGPPKIIITMTPECVIPRFDFASLSGWIILAVSLICMVWFAYDTILELF